MLAVFLVAIKFSQRSTRDLTKELFNAPIDMAAVQLAADVRRTYGELKTFSCTLLMKRGKRLMVEYSRPNRFRIRAYPETGSELVRDVFHNGFETTAVDPKTPDQVLRFNSPDPDLGGYADPMTANAWPPDCMRMSLVVLLDGEKSFLSANSFMFYREPDKRFRLGKKGIDAKGRPTIELLLWDGRISQRATAEMIPTLTTVVVGSEDHLIRSIDPFGA